MRWPFWKGPSAALLEAHEKAQEREERAREAREVSQQLAVIRRRNGFGEAIRTSMGGRQ